MTRRRYRRVLCRVDERHHLLLELRVDAPQRRVVIDRPRLFE